VRSTNAEYHAIVKGAWLEYAVTRQISTGQGERYITQWRIPGWFKHTELGLGLGEAPSIFGLTRSLPVQHAAARVALEKSGEGVPAVLQAPVKRRRPRPEQPGSWTPSDPNGPNRKREARERRFTATDAHRKLRALARAAGLVIRDGQLVRYN
jgi:hypothetical protein